MAAQALHLSSLPVLSVNDKNRPRNCELCGLALPQGSCRCACGVVNFAAYEPTEQEDAEVQRILREIGALEPEKPQLRDVGDLPMRRVGEREGISQCSACGKGLEEGKYQCACGSVNFQAFSRETETLKLVRDVISESKQPEPCPKPEPSPAEPQGRSHSYWTVAMIVISLLSVYIIRRLR